MLIAIENLLSKSEVAALRERLDVAAWQDGAATAGGIARRQKRNLQLDDAAEPARSLSQEVLRRVRAHPTFISAALPRKIYPPKFNRYEGGGEYGAHVDGAILQTLAGETLRSDLSATLFLAEPDTYEGGELQIEGPFGVQEVKLEALASATPANVGKTLSNFADVSASLQAKYEIREGFYVGGVIKHEGKRYGGQPDTAAAYSTTDGTYSQPVPAYTTLDLFATYRINKDLQAKVNLGNVTDENYYLAVYRSGAFLYKGDGRNARLTLTYEF